MSTTAQPAAARGRADGGRNLPPPPWTALLAVTLLGLALGGLAPLGHLVTGGGITAMELLSDPAELPEIGWYSGGVASLNMFLWAAAAALFLTGAVGLWRRDRRFALVLGWLGVLSGVILLDDRFLLHELVLPHFGIPEIVTYAVYGLAGLALVLFGWGTLLRHRESWLLAWALLWMGVSVLLDLSGIDADLRRVAEEMAKMVGAVALVAFPALLLTTALRQSGSGSLA